MPEQQVQQRKQSCISVEDFAQLAKGDCITYLLAPHLLPTNPALHWHGQVEECSTTSVLVTVLDEGYGHDQETVRRTEILGVTKAPALQAGR